MELSGIISLIGTISFALVLVIVGFIRVMKSNKKQRVLWEAYLADLEASKWKPEMHELSVAGASGDAQNVSTTSWDGWRPVSVTSSPAQPQATIAMILVMPDAGQARSHDERVASQAVGVYQVPFNPPQ
ncbi:hypothetical protein DL96DRAFT_1559677 [Flagelloscypha sp. PMI_526]|nr:hypothetical protein DL96DRAFT_1559677 [Flagelloscypha sp. PMI_526]